MRHLQRLDELINRVVRDAELIHDYVQLRFHGGLVLKLNNGVELDGQRLANSSAGRIALASIVGRAVNDVARAADQIVLNFPGGSALTTQCTSLRCCAALLCKLNRGSMFLFVPFTTLRRSVPPPAHA